MKGVLINQCKLTGLAISALPVICASTFVWIYLVNTSSTILTRTRLTFICVCDHKSFNVLCLNFTSYIHAFMLKRIQKFIRQFKIVLKNVAINLLICIELPLTTRHDRISEKATLGFENSIVYRVSLGCNPFSMLYSYNENIKWFVSTSRDYFY